jgi:phosphatidate cytidylyltransferase
MLNGLLPRIITALVMAPLFVWAIFDMPTKYFSYLLLAFVLLGSWEFSKLINLKNHLLRFVYSLSIVLIAITVSNFESIVPFVMYLSIVWWFVNLFWVVSYPQKTSTWFDPVLARLLSGVLLLVPMWLALILLHQNYGPSWFLLLMLVIWAADSGAYFVGKALGRHKLSPFVSPGKTIEGVIGGAVFSMSALILFLQFSEEGQTVMLSDYAGYFFLILIVVGVSVLGDLHESLLKRVSNLKDSGQILPGHGGILDRIDSLTAAAPFFIVGIDLL